MTRRKTHDAGEPRVVRRKGINGLILDLSAASALYGPTEKSLRRLAERGLIPSRRLLSRVVFLRSELDNFFLNLPGVTLDEARQNIARREKGTR